MALSVDRKNALMMFNRYYHSVPDEVKTFVLDMKEAFLELPTIDAVPVVRCKDCKYLRKAWRHPGETACDMWGAVGLNPQGFCNVGARKDGDT